MTYERSTYAWNLPNDCNFLASRLHDDGVNRIWVKAGVDNPGIRTVWKQWVDGRCDVFTRFGIDVCPWFYIYPEDPATQWDTIVRALKYRMSNVIALNAEVEWDGVSEQDVEAWLAGLRGALGRAAMSGTRIGFSSVPSWDGGKFKGSVYHNFPYEAFTLYTDFDMPQDYWLVPDQIAYENLRNIDNSPVIPILTACGEMTDAGIIERATKTLAECKNLAGFSAWECANAGYQFDAVAKAYTMLPPDPQLSIATAPASITTPATDWGAGSEGTVVARFEAVVVVNKNKVPYLGVRYNGQQLPWQEIKL